MGKKGRLFFPLLPPHLDLHCREGTLSSLPPCGSNVVLYDYRSSMHANVYHSGQDHRSQSCKDNRRVLTLNPKLSDSGEMGGFLASAF